jgi:hypothetical protein
VVAGDGGCEAYTAIVWGVLLSRESQKIAEAEPVSNVEGNMCGPVMRGTERSAVVEEHITHKRNMSEPGRSHAWPKDTLSPGPQREGEEP